MRFVADGMLGGLARWLRMLGQDVAYDPATNDNKLLAIAETGMVLLTRDEELHRRARARNLPCLQLTADREEENLARVARAFGISLEMDMELTKCPVCGGELVKASKQVIAERVPSGSLKLYDEFWECKNGSCAKVYWKGSHWKQIMQSLAEARRLLAAQV